MPKGNENPSDGVSEWFHGVPIDVIDNYVLARLEGRALGRMILSSRVLRDLVDDNHPAWWSAHSQMLTGKLRLIKVTTRESHRTPQVRTIDLVCACAYVCCECARDKVREAASTSREEEEDVL
jgi:hypothetical protein